MNNRILLSIFFKQGYRKPGYATSLAGNFLFTTNILFEVNYQEI